MCTGCSGKRISAFCVTGQNSPSQQTRQVQFQMALGTEVTHTPTSPLQIILQSTPRFQRGDGLCPPQMGQRCLCPEPRRPHAQEDKDGVEGRVQERVSSSEPATKGPDLSFLPDRRRSSRRSSGVLPFLTSHGSVPPAGEAPRSEAMLSLWPSFRTAWGLV